MRAEPNLEGDPPFLSSVRRLNEIMLRYPDAISLAPGAPSRDLQVDPVGYEEVERYFSYRNSENQGSEDSRHALLYNYGPSIGIINDLIGLSIEDEFGFQAAAENVVVTSGIQEGLVSVLATLFRGSADTLALTMPCYVGVMGAAHILGVRIGAIQDHAGSPGAALSAMCENFKGSQRRVRAMYVAPDFANPTGALLTERERIELVEVARAKDVYLLEDTTYRFTAGESERLPTLGAIDDSGHVVTFGTFSKICWPGLRVGFVVAGQDATKSHRSRQLASSIALVKGAITIDTPPLCQAIVGGLLLKHGLSLFALGGRWRQIYQDRMSCILDAIEEQAGRDRWADWGIRWNRPTGGFFVRMTVPFEASLDALEESAEEFGVLWTPLNDFFLDGEGGQNEVRLSCSYLESAEIWEGIRRLGAFIREKQHADR